MKNLSQKLVSFKITILLFWSLSCNYVNNDPVYRSSKIQKREMTAFSQGPWKSWSHFYYGAENKHANWPSCFLLFTCFNSHKNKLYNSCTNQIIWSTAFAAMTISCQIKVDNSFGFWSACIFHQQTLVLTDWKIMLRFIFCIERFRWIVSIKSTTLMVTA